VSTATGPDHEGCEQKDAVPHGYCVDTEFGCCRDGVTAARGPSGLGCPELLCYVRKPAFHDTDTDIIARILARM